LTNLEIARRYARALFHLTSSKELLKQRAEDLKQFVDMLVKNPQAKLFFSSPQFDRKKKEVFLKKIFDNDDDQQFLTFLCFLIKKGRFNYLPDIAKEFSQMVNQTLDFLVGVLITATPLDAAFKERIQKNLEHIYQKKLSLKEQVDPALIGGGILIIGNTLLDFSIKHKLEKLKEDLVAVHV
jgi:F-type H+-transporting ATPase subunit delta